MDVLQEIAITEGPPILAASVSLDGGLITLQRSSLRLEFVSCKTQNIFVQVTSLAVTLDAMLMVSCVVSVQGLCRVYERFNIIGSLHSLIWCGPELGHALQQHLCLQGSWKGKSAIIGFFWAKAVDCDFVMVTRAGMEIYTLAADRQVRTQYFCQCALITMIGGPLPGQGSVCRGYQLGWDLLVSNSLAWNRAQSSERMRPNQQYVSRVFKRLPVPAGDAFQKPAAAPDQVVALLSREPPCAARHWRARTLATGQLQI